MFTLFSRIKKERPPQEPSIDSEILDAHLYSIKTCLLEVLNYKKKRYAPTPTRIYWKPVDVEETWESVQKSFSAAFHILCIASTELHVEHKLVLPTTSFHEALKIFISLIDLIDQRIRDTTETQQHSDQQLHHIDDEILQVQHMANRINKLITKDFKYSACPLIG